MGWLPWCRVSWASWEKWWVGVCSKSEGPPGSELRRGMVGGGEILVWPIIGSVLSWRELWLFGEYLRVGCELRSDLLPSYLDSIVWVSSRLVSDIS